MPTVTGHESGFSPDGKTFWVAGGAGYIKAIDVTDPSKPKEIWSGAYYSHGIEISADGDTMYQTDPINGSLGVFDVSQVQDRKPSPKVRELRRITWDTVSIPQNSRELEIDGKPYLLEFDEFAFRFNPATIEDKVGGARLIDMSKPTQAADRLRPAPAGQHARGAPRRGRRPGAARADAGLRLRVPLLRGPAPRRSGDRRLLVHQLRPADLRHQRTRSTRARSPTSWRRRRRERSRGFGAGNLAFSQPAFDPERRDVWYTDAGSGFYSLHLGRGVWPKRR